MLGFRGGVSIPLIKGGVKAPPAKRECRAGPKAGARRGFTPDSLVLPVLCWAKNIPMPYGRWDMKVKASITASATSGHSA